jgi:putative ABC transport system permease protein
VEPDLRPLPTLAADPDTFIATFPEYQLSPDQVDGWHRDRQAFVVGPGSGLLFGWNAGDRVTVQPSVPPYMPMQLRVVCRAEHSRDPITNWCRRDYFDAELEAYGDVGSFVNFFFVKCATEADLSYFRRAIDELFTSSLDQTRTVDDRSFINEFLTQQLDLPRNLTLLGVLSVLVALMAAANTLKMSFRDRIPELATLKALGFNGRVLWFLTQSESVLICLAGGAVGAMVPYVALTHTPLADVPVPLIQHLRIDPSVCVEAIGVSILVGVAAALWAAWPAVRMRATDGLRSLE